MPRDRIRNEMLLARVSSAEAAAAFFRDGMKVGVSGFSATGYPKVVPTALAQRVKSSKEDLGLYIWSGASIGHEIDGLLSEQGIIRQRLPYQNNKNVREGINAGTIGYVDQHLGHAPQMARYGWYGKLDVAVIEAAAITEEGDIVPAAGVGNAPTFAQMAESVIIEINDQVPLEIEGIHDIFIPADPPQRGVIPLLRADQRIGTTAIKVDPEKIRFIVPSSAREKGQTFTPIEPAHRQIAGHLIDFLAEEVKRGRLPASLLPFQCGVGSVANAVFAGLAESPWENLTVYSEVIQDSMLDLIEQGKLSFASGCALNVTQAGMERFYGNIGRFRERVLLRPQEISNHAEVIRRLGLIAVNTALEADIYGNINSSHVMGSKLMNGIGGSGDFTRNAYLSIFVTQSTAKDGSISCIVPMVPHVDHTEHDVAVVVTEQGVADLRGLSPRERARAIIQNCTHPDYREGLADYLARASKETGGQTPHLLDEAFAWYRRYREHGTMQA